MGLPSLTVLQTDEARDPTERSIQKTLHLLGLKRPQIVPCPDTPSLESEIGVIHVLGHTVSRIGQGCFTVLVIGHQDASTQKMCGQTVKGGVECHRY